MLLHYRGSVTRIEDQEVFNFFLSFTEHLPHYLELMSQFSAEGHARKLGFQHWQGMTLPFLPENLSETVGDLLGIGKEKPLIVSLTLLILRGPHAVAKGLRVLAAGAAESSPQADIVVAIEKIRVVLHKRDMLDGEKEEDMQPASLTKRFSHLGFRMLGVRWSEHGMRWEAEFESQQLLAAAANLIPSWE